MMSDKALKPTIVITGASSGIGRELALICATEASVLLVARSLVQLQALALDIQKAGGKADIIALDITMPDAAEKIVNKLNQLNSYCDILINNAGYGLIGDITALDGPDQLGIIDLNCHALTLLSLAFLPDMKLRKRGGILNVASMAGFIPGPHMSVYYASKAYVLSLSQAMWHEMRPYGVTVTALCPGPVRTGFFKRATGAEETFRPLKMMSPITAEKAALAGWRGFKAGKRVVFPTFFNQMSTWGMLFTPKAILLPMITRVQKARRSSSQAKP
jgi:uncharacterized protein